MAKNKMIPMLAAVMSKPKPVSDKQVMREHAKHSMRRATEDWVDGRISSKEHNAVHARAQHLLSGKHPSKFRGQTGERKIRGL